MTLGKQGSAGQAAELSWPAHLCVPMRGAGGRAAGSGCCVAFPCLLAALLMSWLQMSRPQHVHTTTIAGQVAAAAEAAALPLTWRMMGTLRWAVMLRRSSITCVSCSSGGMSRGQAVSGASRLGGSAVENS